VNAVIGYEGDRAGKRVPVFVTKPEDCSRLIFDEKCYQNLATYLFKPEVKDFGKIGVVAKGCDSRAINVLIREARVKREDIYIIGVACPRMDKATCTACEQLEPVVYDVLIPSDVAPVNVQPVNDPTATMSAEEKWEHWMNEFSRCIKCYACRQICPICHCTRCIAEKNRPQWIDSSPHPRGNLKWNMIRAFHMMGRCIECGECERACPMNIPLVSFSEPLKKVIRENFESIPGMDHESPSPLADFKEDDKEDFFK